MKVRIFQRVTVINTVLQGALIFTPEVRKVFLVFGDADINERINLSL
jgi:hypothetical protein